MANIYGARNYCGNYRTWVIGYFQFRYPSFKWMTETERFRNLGKNTQLRRNRTVIWTRDVGSAVWTEPMADALLKRTLRFTAVKSSTRASQVIAEQALVRAVGVGGTGASGSSGWCLDLAGWQMPLGEKGCTQGKRIPVKKLEENPTSGVIWRHLKKRKKEKNNKKITAYNPSCRERGLGGMIESSRPFWAT